MAVSDAPRQAAGLDITEADDGLVVFEPTTRKVHHLNVTATLVFELCTGDNDEQAIIEVVRTAFQMDTAPVAEVTQLLASLRGEGLLI